jgi:hypothetical protein
MCGSLRSQHKPRLHGERKGRGKAPPSVGGLLAKYSPLGSAPGVGAVESPPRAGRVRESAGERAGRPPKEGRPMPPPASLSGISSPIPPPRPTATVPAPALGVGRRPLAVCRWGQSQGNDRRAGRQGLCHGAIGSSLLIDSFLLHRNQGGGGGHHSECGWAWKMDTRGRTSSISAVSLSWEEAC